MLTIPQYLIESSFCLLIFYGFYHLFLKKETFFQLNRAYLILAPLLSIGIPLLNISFQKDAPAESLEALFYPAIQSAHNLNELVWEQMRAPSPVFSLSVADVLMAIYLIGVALMFFTLGRSLWNLSKIIRGGKHSKNNEFTLVETYSNFPAASFFGYIFWNQQITDEQKLILEHEKVHIRQWHSLDVLLMEICVIIKWFNPLIYWFRNALKATHEYIADQYVIQQKSNVEDYATLLVNQHKQLRPAPLTNTFYSLTKKRLQMMMQSPSKRIDGLKYLTVFPMVIGLMLLFSFNLLEEIPQVGERLEEMNSVLEDIGETTVFEINKSYLTEESTVLGQAEKKSSDYEIHLGDFKYNAGNTTKFNSLEYKNNITLREIQTLLNNPILFTKNGKKLDLIKIDLVIPNPNVSYSTTHRSTTVGTEGEEKPFIIEAAKTEDFKFTKPAINAFLKMIHDGSNFYLNGYGKSEVFIGEFLVNYDIGEISNKEMDSYFYFPENPNNNKLQIGLKEICIRGLETGGTAAPARVNKSDFFKSLREGNLKFMQNGQPLVLDDLYLTHVSDKNNYTSNIVKNKAGKFEILISYDTPPFKIKANKTEGILFSEEEIQAIEDNIKTFDFIELKGKNKEDTFLKTVFFTELTLRYNNRNHNFESTAKNPIFDTPSLINNQQLKFKWGSIEFPIWHSNNPHFKGKPRLQISTEQLIENLTAEMVVLDDNKIFDVQSLSLDFIFYNNKKKNDPEYVFTPPFKLLFKQGEEMKLFPPNQETLTKYINNFGKIYIDIPELGDLHSVIIEVGKEGRPIPIIPESESSVYTYQVIMPKYRKTGKTVLRIDTTMTKNKRIVDMYRNPERFYIIHIPRFHTNENLLWEDTEKLISENYRKKSVVKSSFTIKQDAKTSILLPVQTKQTNVLNDSNEVEPIYFHPFSYSNQIVIGEKSLRKPDGTYRKGYVPFMDDYISNNGMKQITDDEGLAAFGEVGRKGIFVINYQHKKKRKRTPLNIEKKPLIVYYTHPSFPMLTHKLTFKDLDVSIIEKSIKYPAGSKEANYYGEAGKNGIIQMWFKRPNSKKKITKEPIKITIKKANPVWSKTNWFQENQVYLMKNIQLSESIKLLLQLPDNQLNFTNLKDESPIHVSIHGGLSEEHNKEWVLQKIKEKFPFEIQEKMKKRKVLVLKRGTANSLNEYEYYQKILPKTKSIVLENQQKNLKTIAPGYISDYKKTIKDAFELPLIDETGFFGDSAICLGLDISSIENMQQQLKVIYGLELVEEERLIPVFEFSN